MCQYHGIDTVAHLIVHKIWRRRGRYLSIIVWDCTPSVGAGEALCSPLEQHTLLRPECHRWGVRWPSCTISTVAQSRGRWRPVDATVYEGRSVADIDGSRRGDGCIDVAYYGGDKKRKCCFSTNSYVEAVQDQTQHAWAPWRKRYPSIGGKWRWSRQLNEI